MLLMYKYSFLRKMSAEAKIFLHKGIVYCYCKSNDKEIKGAALSVFKTRSGLSTTWQFYTNVVIVCEQIYMYVSKLYNVV